LLITCAENNYINATIALCKKGVNIYHKTQNGKTASMIAYEKGHIDIVLIMGALRAPITPQRGSG
jgi:ankyrin repeat protein